MNEQRLAKLSEIATIHHYIVETAKKRHAVPCQVCKHMFVKNELVVKNTCRDRKEWNQYARAGEVMHILKACITCYDAHCVLKGDIEKEV